MAFRSHRLTPKAHLAAWRHERWRERRLASAASNVERHLDPSLYSHDFNFIVNHPTINRKFRYWRMHNREKMLDAAVNAAYDEFDEMENLITWKDHIDLPHKLYLYRLAKKTRALIPSKYGVDKRGTFPRTGPFPGLD